VIGYTPKAQEMADKIERRANEMASEGYALISCAMTPVEASITTADKTLLPSRFVFLVVFINS